MKTASVLPLLSALVLSIVGCAAPAEDETSGDGAQAIAEDEVVAAAFPLGADGEGLPSLDPKSTTIATWRLFGVAKKESPGKVYPVVVGYDADDREILDAVFTSEPKPQIEVRDPKGRALSLEKDEDGAKVVIGSRRIPFDALLADWRMLGEYDSGQGTSSTSSIRPRADRAMCVQRRAPLIAGVVMAFSGGVFAAGYCYAAVMSGLVLVPATGLCAVNVGVAAKGVQLIRSSWRDVRDYCFE